MDSGLAAVLGSFVGILGTFGTTWLNAKLTRKRPDPAEEATKRLLRELLDHPVHNWRHMHTLANVVGMDENTVRRLLLEIGARGSAKDGNLWGLVSRHPLKDADSDRDSKEFATLLLEKWQNEEAAAADAIASKISQADGRPMVEGRRPLGE